MSNSYLPVSVYDRYSLMIGYTQRFVLPSFTLKKGSQVSSVLREVMILQISSANVVVQRMLLSLFLPSSLSHLLRSLSHLSRRVASVVPARRPVKPK